MARLRLLLHKKVGKVSGKLKISRELDGGGPIAGAAKGKELIFTTRAAYCKITWLGRVEGRTIDGTYLALLEDGSTQRGIWRAVRN